MSALDAPVEAVGVLDGFKMEDGEAVFEIRLALKDAKSFPLGRWFCVEHAQQYVRKVSARLGEPNPLGVVGGAALQRRLTKKKEAP